MLKHPDLRMRRLREKAPVRDMVRETRISVSNFIYPMFVTHGLGASAAKRSPSMPGVLSDVASDIAARRGDSRRSSALGVQGRAAVRAAATDKDAEGTQRLGTTPTANDPGSHTHRIKDACPETDWSSPTSASASTPTTAIVASFTAIGLTTTPRWNSWPAPR